MPTVTASSFADPQDLAAFKAAKARGLSDKQAFRVGDNCIGCWGDFTGDPDGVPMCALPPEIWKEKFPNGGARGAIVNLTRSSGETCVAQLRDTMPHLDHIENGAGIDLNPAAAKALGLKPPFMEHNLTWDWAE